MTLTTLGAFAIDEYPEAVAVMLFYQIGELFLSSAVGKSRKVVAALTCIHSVTASVVREGKEVTVDPSDVSVGETITVRLGEEIPIDAVIVIENGDTFVDMSSLTGDALPLEKHTGDIVMSGGVNLGSVIRLRTVTAFENSTISRILNMVENASKKIAYRTENFITYFAHYYTSIVLLWALAISVIPSLLCPSESEEGVRRALVFLVISCPCALILFIPLTFSEGIGGASRASILIKGATYIEAMSKLTSVIIR